MMYRRSYAHGGVRPAFTLILCACAVAPPAQPTEQNGSGATVVATTADPVAAPFIVSGPSVTDTTLRFGIALRLSGITGPDTTPAAASVITQPLPATRAASLLEQLAGAPPQPAQRNAFRFATSSLPAPRPGTTTRIPFADGSAPRPDPAASGPLRVTHTSPRGTVGTSSQIAITFSQPMVSLSAPPPAPDNVRITPYVRGTWRWLDVSTLVFESDGELPGATRYTVHVPAGLRSAAGMTLPDAIEWTFTTSPPQLAHVAGIDVYGTDPSEPVIVIVFDQRIDPAAVLPLLRLEVAGQDIPLRAANAEERGRGMPAFAQEAPERTLVVRAAGRIRARGEGYTMPARLHVAAGVPSLEGAERSREPAVHEFQLRRGLNVVEHGCGRADSCIPGAPWTIRFSHSLKPVIDTASWIRVEPALPGATVAVWNDHIVIFGAARPHTTYTVHLDSTIATRTNYRLGAVAPLQFEIGAPVASLRIPGGLIAVLPRNEDELPVLAQNTERVDVEIRAVAPSDMPAYAALLLAVRHGHSLPELPGRLLSRRTVQVTAMPGVQEARLGLTEELSAAGGHVIVAVTAAGDTMPGAITWVQQHDIMLDVAEDGAAVTVRATDRAGRALANVELQLERLHGNAAPVATARTDDRGIARFEAAYDRRGVSWFISATSAGRSAVYTPRMQLLMGELWHDWQPALREHIVTDRPIYSPGDTVRFGGWLRVASAPGYEPAMPSAQQLIFEASGPRGSELVTDTVPVSADGRVEGSFVLPPETNAGSGWLRLQLGTLHGSIMYQVEEVRRPNFDASLAVDAGTYLPGARVGASVTARYFTGGAVPNAEVQWSIRSTPARYHPPGVDDYEFGMVRYPQGRWYEPQRHTTRTDAAGAYHLGIAIDSLRPNVAMNLMIQASVTDLDRQSRTSTRVVVVHPASFYVGLRTPARFVRQDEPLVVDVLVVDIDGRAVAERPVALRAMRQQRRLEQGQLVVAEVQRGACTLQSGTRAVRCTLRSLPPGDYLLVATVTDAQGRASVSELAVRVAGETIPANARTARDSVAVHTDRTEYEPGDTARVVIESSLREGHALVSLRRGGVLETHTTRLTGGIATIALPVRDAHVPNINLNASIIGVDGRLASGDAHFTVDPVTRRLTVTVEPSASMAQPGETTTIEVSVHDADGRPVANAGVLLSGVDEALQALSRAPLRDPLKTIYPHAGAGVIDHTLRAHSAGSLTSDEGVITGFVIDATTGRPIPGAWVEIASGTGAWTGVDGRYRIVGAAPGRHMVHARAEGYVSVPADSVLLTRDAVARAHFLMMTPRAMLLQDGMSYRMAAASLMLREDVAVDALGMSVVAAPPPPAQPAPATVLRNVFTPVAAFVTNARTGADGTVTIPVTLPHSLTRYRVRAVASQGERAFGAGEASLTVRRPLMVRAMPPRFLHRGDHFDLTVLVENRSGVAHEVEVAVRAVNAQLSGPAGQRVHVPADDRVELRFPAIAGAPGSATFQVAASGGSADAAEVTIPVLLPAVTETFAVYGQLDDARAVSYPLLLPTGSIPDQTRVDIGFSTTAVHGLRDAVMFLINCFFDLPEVSASRTIALSALRDLPAATPWPVDAIDAAIRSDITRLARAQLNDGGWSIFPARFDADPFITVHAAHALARARAKGYAVPESVLERAARHLARMDEHAPRTANTPGYEPAPFAVDYPLPARHAVQAYALHVRRQLGHDVAASAAGLLHAAGVNALTAEALGWLLPLLSADALHANDAANVRRELDARIVRSAGTAGVVSGYNAGGRHVLYSPRRTDAVVLAALVADSAADQLVASLARGLMAHRVGGRWANTQENVFAVAALADYLAGSEATEPALTARAWTGPRLAAQHAFRGRSDDRVELAVPADSIGDPGTSATVTLAREGAGRVYYRVALQHAVAGLTPPLARGFDVTRSYEAVDDATDVRRDPDGTWRIRLGARVRVRIAIGNAGPRYHVAIVDPLPAAFEAINPALAGAGVARPPADRTVSPDRIPLYAEHVNVRSDRFEAFRTRLDAGRYDLVYIAIATTPGDFAAPAPRAEEMYAPETFGRGATERVIVERRTR